MYTTSVMTESVFLFSESHGEERVIPLRHNIAVGLSFFNGGNMTKWMNGVPVPGVWTRAYKNGWSANVEMTKAGHYRAVVLNAQFREVGSIACASLEDAKSEAIALRLRSSHHEVKP